MPTTRHEELRGAIALSCGGADGGLAFASWIIRIPQYGP